MNFYVLINPHAGSGAAVTDWLLSDEVALGDAPRCPVCGRFVGLRPALPPIEVEIKAWGKRWGDIAHGPGNELLVSSHFRQAATEWKIRGIRQFLAAKIVRATSRRHDIGPPPSYELAFITQGAAVIDELKSEIDRELPIACWRCHAGGVLRGFQRVVLEEGSWTGEDIFFAWGFPGTIVVSERFRAMCDAVGMENCVLIPAEEYSASFYRR